VSYKPRSLFRLIDDINTSLFLPHIQRPFVWDEDQMCKLFDSLMRNYPIQTFLFWRTKDAIKVRKFMPSIDWDADLHDYYDAIKSKENIEKVFVLDGQQRLQTLFAIFHGTIKSNDGKYQLDAYIDITNGHIVLEGGLLYQLIFFSNNQALPFYRLSDLLEKDAQINAEEIADEINDKLDGSLEELPEVKKKRNKLVRRNISQLVSLLREEKYFWVQELDGVANVFPYKKILDIFVRVNSGGTKLDAADLMFAAMKEGWSDVEINIEEIVDLLNNNKLCFDKSFALKCLVVANGKGSELNPEKFTSSDGELLLKTIENNWTKAEDTFNQLRDFIQNELQLYSDKVVRSYVSFIPLFDYLYHNPKPDNTNRLLMRGYYYKSQLFNWYAAQTDNIINVLHGILGKTLSTQFPINGIKAYFSNRGKDVDLSMTHLSNMRLRYIILNLVYVERFGKSPFNVLFRGNDPHIDHIYPRSALKNDLGLSTPAINHIGNYRFVGATDNIRKKAELPESYFGRLKGAGINIENHLLLPDESKDPSLLKFDIATYESFRDSRLAAIFQISEKIVNP